MSSAIVVCAINGTSVFSRGGDYKQALNTVILADCRNPEAKDGNV
ncbi:MAG: hypothetical protein PHH59_16705 [Methylovulum sp.]|nr:hypothetical protein [Methylovulum sp.]MDD2725641.1 hypothetical protein [Methylovulum sp.]MDD5125571.1 hypothetical protein [Methylovulum sp.]